MSVVTAPSLDPGGATAGAPSLDGEVTRGFRWSLANRALLKIGRLLAMIVLARLLVPEDFGVYAVGLVVTDVLTMVASLGMVDVLIRWPGDVEATRLRATATGIALLWSGALFAVVVLLAPQLAAALGTPAAAPVLRVMALSIPLGGLVATSAAMVTRRFRQDLRARADLLGLVCYAVVSVSFAAAGWGAWALGLGQVAGIAVMVTMLLVAAPPVRPRFDLAEAHVLLRAGLPLAGAALLQFVFLNLDYVIVGRVLGPAVLGVYVIAFNLANWPVSVLREAIRSVALPGFARLHASEPDRVTIVLRRALAAAAAGTFVIIVPLVLLTEPALQLVYGADWVDAAGPLRVLAVLGVLRVVIHLGEDVLTAIGATRWLVPVHAVWLLTALVGLTIGANVAGTVGVAVGHGVASLLVTLLVGAALRRGLGEPMGPVARGLVQPVIVASLAAAVGGLLLTRVHGVLLPLAVVGTIVTLVQAPTAWQLLRRLRVALAGAPEGDAPGGRLQPVGPREPPRPPARHVSVILPAYNAEATLAAQLDALCLQDYGGSWDVTVVNNRSTDGTVAVANAYLDRLPGMRVVDAADRAGVAHARNVGWASTIGDLLMFCDSDDVVAPSWVRELADAARHHDMVQGRLDVESLNSTSLQAAHDPPPSDRLPVTLGQPFIIGCNMASWRDALERLDGWNSGLPGEVGEDLELSLRAHSAGLSLGFAPEAVVAYRYRESRLDMVRQIYKWAQVEPALYRRFRHDLVRRRRLRHTVATWGWLALNLPLLLSPRRRGHWRRRAAAAAGLLTGSIKQRVLYV